MLCSDSHGANSGGYTFAVIRSAWHELAEAATLGKDLIKGWLYFRSDSHGVNLDVSTLTSVDSTPFDACVHLVWVGGMVHRLGPPWIPMARV